MQSTALKEQGSSLKETAPGMETLKLVHDNTLTSFGYAIENYNAEPTNVKPDFHPAPPLISLNEVESRFQKSNDTTLAYAMDLKKRHSLNDMDDLPRHASPAKSYLNPYINFESEAPKKHKIFKERNKSDVQLSLRVQNKKQGRVSELEQLCPDKIMIKTSQRLFKKVKISKKKRRNKEPLGIETLMNQSERVASDGKQHQPETAKSTNTKQEDPKSTLISAHG